jgi:hypothetical protein
MESYGEKNISTVLEKTQDGLRITVESEAAQIDYSALQDAMAARSEDFRLNGKFIQPRPKTTISTLDLQIVKGRLEMMKSLGGGLHMHLSYVDLISSSDRFFTDEKVNSEVQAFLSENFPNDFERTKTYDRLREAWSARNEDSIPFEEFFNPDAKTVENYADTFLMVLGYGFPVLFHRLPYDITSEEMFEVASDMKSAYGTFMTASTESELADIAFGSRRKAFRRLVPLLTVSELALVTQLSKIVSADTLEWALRGVEFTAPRPIVECWYSDAEVLANFSPMVQRHLVRDLFVSSSDADDAFNMVKRYATDYTFFKGVKTVEQLHDKAVTIIPEITEDSRIESIDQSIRSAQEVFIPEISSKLELLVSQKEFVRIGKELNICIGSASYFEKSIDGTSYCYKILKDGALIGAIEVSRDPEGQWRSIQCRGERNVHLTTETVIIEKLLDKLEETPAAFTFAGVS